MTGCLHIIEEATFHNNGSGSYKMTFDMSELKGMVDMMKGMGDMEGMGDAADSTGIYDGGDFTPPAEPEESQDPMGGLGEQFKGISETLKGVDGISNIVEINDTTNYSFGYSFEFANIAALNRALKIVGKDKFDTKTEETFKFTGKKFERLNAGDMSAELKNVMSEGEDMDDEG